MLSRWRRRRPSSSDRGRSSDSRACRPRRTGHDRSRQALRQSAAPPPSTLIPASNRLGASRSVVEDRRALAEDGDRLAQRHQIAADCGGPRPLRSRAWRSRGPGRARLRSRAFSISSCITRRMPSRFMPSSVELGDAAQDRDVGVAVAAVAALGASRRAPGRAARRCAASADASRPVRRRRRSRRRPGCGTVRCIGCAHVSELLGFTVVAAASCSIAARCASVRSVGTCTSTVTIRSPVCLRGLDALALDAVAAAGLGARLEPQRDARAVERRHVDVAAERRLGER